MTKTTRREHLHVLTAVLGFAAAGPTRADGNPLHDTWTGILEAGNVLLTLRFAIDAKGVVMTSVDQGGVSVAGTDVVVEGPRISVSFKPIHARFEGVLSDERHLDGVFTQGRAIKLRLTRGDIAEAPPEQAWPVLTQGVLEEKRAVAGTPGMGVAWSRGGRSKVLVAGLRCSDAQAVVQPDDLWHWGSITKSMTATLCARLVEAGVVRWDTTVGQVLDDEGAMVPQAYRDATLLHLLSHRAGLQPNIAEINDFSRASPDTRAERLRYARLALAQTPVAGLGAKQAYSNNGYVVVGAMLEKLTRRPWETLLQAEVFAPLGIQRAGFGAPGSHGRLDQPVGHVVTEGQRAPRFPGGPGDDNPVAMGPSGRVHMPLTDMLVHLRAHLERPAAVLKTATWDKLHTPHFGDNCALGWYTRKDGRLWHGGSNTMWFGQVLVDPKTGTVGAVCGNDAAPRTRAVVDELLFSARATPLG